jgi:hypothetical protein|tara:strand:- start:25 stop:435 length:411 start_codon:yes stop_codon:yes gene_type:complete
MLDNDANFACVIRELLRRGELERPRSLALPPEDGANGTMCYMSFRWHLKHYGEPKGVDRADRSDILAEVWREKDSGNPFTEHWWVTLQDGSEVGPFPTKKEASSEAVRFLVRDGWVVMKETPWDGEDEVAWPVAYK